MLSPSPNGPGDPALREFEMYQTLRQLWLTLNHVQLQPNTQQFVGNNLKNNYLPVLEEFKCNYHAKVINLGDLDQSDMAYLAKQGISSDYLLRNLRKTMRGGYRDALA